MRLPALRDGKTAASARRAKGGTVQLVDPPGPGAISVRRARDAAQSVRRHASPGHAGRKRPVCLRDTQNRAFSEKFEGCLYPCAQGGDPQRVRDTQALCGSPSRMHGGLLGPRRGRRGSCGVGRASVWRSAVCEAAGGPVIAACCCRGRCRRARGARASAARPARRHGAQRPPGSPYVRG